MCKLHPFFHIIMVDFHDGVLTYWDEEQQQEFPVDYATLKKSGDFYVITYDYTTSGVLQGDDIQTDITKSQAVGPDFGIGLQGVNVTAKNSAIYFDDFKLTKADGTVLFSNDYTSDKKVATVDAKGTVTGKKAGKATISVKANGKTVKVTVTVKKK